MSDEEPIIAIFKKKKSKENKRDWEYNTKRTPRIKSNFCKFKE